MSYSYIGGFTANGSGTSLSASPIFQRAVSSVLLCCRAWMCHAMMRDHHSPSGVVAVAWGDGASGGALTHSQVIFVSSLSLKMKR